MSPNELEDFITTRKTIQTGRVKSLLYKYNIKQCKCEACGVEDTYNSKPITLQLHHIDGDNTNNQFMNLQILCPNCHSQTQTFRAKKPLTEESILEACEDAKTISEVVRNLKRYPSGDLYKKVQTVIEKFDLPIKKYEYTANNVRYSTENKSTANILKERQRAHPRQVEHDICKVCNNTFEKRDKNHRYCSYQCSRKAACRYQVDEEKAIELVKELGWSKAAKHLGIDSKYPDCNLRLIIKRYIKHNNLDIDIYNISKHAKHSRFKKVGVVGPAPTLDGF